MKNFIAASVATIFLTRFYDKRCYIVYPLVVLSLLPALLIEHRYYIPGLVLFLAFRKDEGEVTETTLASLFFFISVAFVHGIANKLFYL